jgi:hypothetical protein
MEPIRRNAVKPGEPFATRDGDSLNLRATVEGDELVIRAKLRPDNNRESLYVKREAEGKPPTSCIVASSGGIVTLDGFGAPTVKIDSDTFGPLQLNVTLFRKFEGAREGRPSKGVRTWSKPTVGSSIPADKRR